MQLRTVFDDLVRFETELWNALEVRLQHECGISLGTFNVMLIISETDSCRVYDIADRLSITVGGASQAVDRLVKQGFGERHQHPTDRRSSIVGLTEAGEKAVAQAGPPFDDELRIWFEEAMPRDTLTQFSTALAVLRQRARQR